MSIDAPLIRQQADNDRNNQRKTPKCVRTIQTKYLYFDQQFETVVGSVHFGAFSETVFLFQEKENVSDLIRILTYQCRSHR